MSTGLYYRRWTRMYIHPAAKYFNKYDTQDYGMQNMMFLANRQNPVPQNKRYATRMAVNHEQQINNKLIKNLFLKYPDLKYESINRLKYHGDNFNSYSYSYAFITQQKKLMKSGYTMRKAFELVEQKFQQKMKRKIDQSLISRGLAIRNRARSLLTIYQQQVENESRLKMLRTRRQVLKYEQKLKQIDEAIKRPIQNQEIQVKQNYQRIFDKISQMSREQINKQYQNQKRSQLVQRMEKQFKDMFSQFYQIAGYKDRLRGLTDEEIKENIRTSPNKIKRLTKELVKYLKNKGGITISPGGELKINENINEKLKSFLYSSPTVKIGILNHMIGYQNPNFSYRQKLENEAKSKLAQLRTLKKQKYQKDESAIIKQNKIKQMQTVIQKNIPEDNNRSYRLLESAEQRILRLQIKYLQSFISNSNSSTNSNTNSSTDKIDQSVFQRLNHVIEEFRRLKFRMEKRYKADVQGEFMFPEHRVFNKHPKEIQDRDIQYEDLLEYLRRKSEERRLKAIDQVDDNKISEMIKKQPRKQIPKSESEQHNINN